MNKYFSQLETKRLWIRRFRPSDIEPFLRYRSAPDVIRFQEWTDVSREEVRFFVNGLRMAEPGVPGQAFQFAVEHKRDAALIGDMALSIKADNPCVAEIGYTLAPAYQRQGYGYEMVSALLDYAFSTLAMHRVYARVLRENAASINLLERLRFRCEGALVEQIWFHDAWRDQLIFAQLAREWEQTQQPLPH